MGAYFSVGGERMDFKTKMKSLRVQNHFTQEEIAHKLFVSRKTISSWENGRSYPDINTLIKISDVYCISLDKLLREDEIMLKQYNDSFQADKKNSYIFRYSYLLNIILLFLIYADFVWTNLPFEKTIEIIFWINFYVLCLHLPIKFKKFISQITWKQGVILLFIGIVTFGLQATQLFSSPKDEVRSAYLIGFWTGYVIKKALPAFSLWLMIFLLPVLDNKHKSSM